MAPSRASSPAAPRFTAGGAALHALLAEVARAPRGAPGLAVGREALLLALAPRPPTTVAALARSGVVPAATRQGVQRLVDALAAEGLVERLPNPRHRRAPTVALTRAGRLRAEAAWRAQAARLNDLARELDPEALRAAARLLRRLRGALAAERSAPARRARYPAPPVAHAGAGRGRRDEEVP